MSINLVAAREAFELAFSRFFADADPAGSFLAWAGIVDTYIFEWRDFKPLDHWIDKFGQLTAKFPDFPDDSIKERATSAIFAALLFRQPGHPDMQIWTERVRDIMHNTVDPVERMLICNNLILYYLWTGRINEAGMLLAMFEPLASDNSGPPFARVILHRTRALHGLYFAQPKTGLIAVEDGLKLAEESGIRIFDIMFMGVAIYLATIMNDLALARHFLKRMTDLMPRGGSYATIYHVGQSSLVALLANELAAAVALAEENVRLTAEAGVPLITLGNRMSLMFILSEARQYERLEYHMREARQQALLYGSAHIEAWCSGHEALKALNLGNDTEFAERFCKMASLCRSTGLRILTYLPTTVYRLCAKALELGVETGFVKDLIRHTRLVPVKAELAPAAWPFPLKVHTLGKFCLTRDDTPLAFSGKVQQKPLAMLKAMVALGGREVAEERLADVLWPEADGDQAHRAFDTTLHRLRKLIAYTDAITLREGRISLNGQHCWLDTWSFEQATARFDGLLKGNGDNCPPPSPEEVMRSFNTITGLYQGHFLATDGEEEWIIPMRDRLREKFIDAVDRCGAFLIAAGCVREAIALYSGALALPIVSEKLSYDLMRCLHRLGRSSEAVTVYRRCRDELSKKFGIKPSRKMEELHVVIRANP